MIDISTGRYWDMALSPLDGCTPCSPGCRSCWLAEMAHQYRTEGDPITEKVGEEPVRFNGTVILCPSRLQGPIKRKKPTVYLVLSDLFHEKVLESYIMEVYKTMIQCKQHTFLVLTKRDALMASFLSSSNCFSRPDFANIWHGLTVCNQKEAETKIPIFLQVPGKKFLSIEPMLGPIDLEKVPPVNLGRWCGFGPSKFLCDTYKSQGGINSVILGGETGPGARPLHPDWVRSVRDQCAAAGVPFFFKGWGEFAPESSIFDDGSPSHDSFRRNAQCHICDRGERLYRVGKVRAGRLLDGRTHDDLPWLK